MSKSGKGFFHASSTQGTQSQAYSVRYDFFALVNFQFPLVVDLFEISNPGS